MKVSSALLIGCSLLSAFSAVPLVSGAYVGGTPHEKPVDLNNEDFEAALDDAANPYWLFKFYAPWCGHCKRLAPVLESIAPKLKGKMAIGKIDCTRFKKPCNAHKVTGFPTLKYAIDGEFFPYSGGRDEKSIIAFAEKMSSPAVIEIRRLEEAKKFADDKADEGIVFLGSGKENSPLHKVFSRVARKMQASAYFLWMEQYVSPTDDGRDNSYVDKVESGYIEPRRWETTEADMTEENFEAWVKDQNVPTMATLTSSNFPRISRNGRPLLMAIVDMEKEQLVAHLTAHMKDFLIRAPQEYVDARYYGLFDGKRWEKFLSQFGVKQEDNPQFLIIAPLNLPGEKTFWRNETYTTLPEFLKAVDDGSIPPRSPKKATFKDEPLAWMTEKFQQYLPWSFIPLFLLVLVIILVMTPSAEYYEEEYDDDEIIDDDDEPKEDESKKDK